MPTKKEFFAGENNNLVTKDSAFGVSDDGYHSESVKFTYFTDL